MVNLCKVLAVLLGCVFLVAGEKLDSKGTRPVELLLSTKENESRLPVAVGNLIKDRNKDINLEIRTDEGEEGKLNLIIARSKGNQNTEKNIDRYSPAYNAEHDLINDDTSRKSKSTFEMNKNWDSSRLDSSTFYPSQNAEMFPYLSLRQVLQTQQPLMLQQNQFSPLQSLRYFEDNLQRQFLPHMFQSFGSLQGVPMSMLMPQPFISGGNSLNGFAQQRLPNIQQNLNGFQQGLAAPFQLNNGNVPIGVSNQVISPQNPPLNKYPLDNTYRQNKHSSQHENSPHNNGLHYQSNTPLQHNSKHLRNTNIPQSTPVILAPNKQPIPPHNRPQYTLERNYQNIPLQRNVKHQQPTSPQHNNVYVPQINHGANNRIQNYEPQQNPHINAYQQIPNKQRYEQLYHTRQQTEGNHPQRIPNQIQNNQPILYRPQNIQNSVHGHTNNFQDRTRLPLRELSNKNVPLNRPGLYAASHQGSSQSQLANSFQNPSFRKEHVANLPDDKRPDYSRLPEKIRPLHSQNYAHMSVNDHPRNPSTTLTTQPENNFPLDGTRMSPPQLHKVHSRPLSNTDITSLDLHGQIKELRETRPKRRRRRRKYKVDDVYDSSTPTKKRKLKRQRSDSKEVGKS